MTANDNSPGHRQAEQSESVERIDPAENLGTSLDKFRDLKAREEATRSNC